MGKVCVNCGKALNLFNETYPLWPDTDECFCSSCLNRLNTYFNREKASWQCFFEVKDMLNDHGFTPKGIEYIQKLCCYYDSCKLDEIQAQEQLKEKKEKMVQRDRRIAQSRRIIVTTADLKEDYEVLGPVYFQVSNKGVFSNALDKLIEKYQDQIDSMRDYGTISQDHGASLGDILFMPLFDLALRENKFETAFYVATEELKVRAAILDADAIVGMRQDIDMDTNGFQYFYLQMYGTAVRFRKTGFTEHKQPGMSDELAVETRTRRRVSRLQE